MKYLLTLILIFFSEFTFTQNLTDVARSKELTWYGVDFTQARFIGFETDELNNCPIDDWSFTNLSDEDSHFIKYYFWKDKIYENTETAKKRNDTIKCQHLRINHTYEIDIDNIKQVVADYKFSGVGFGVLFIVESFEKINNSIFIWVVYIDNSNGQIISSRRYIGGKYGGNGVKYSKKGVELVIKVSGKDLKRYK